MDGSLGYASRLSHREDLGGQLGAPELSETAQSHASKVKQLAQLVRSAQHLVVFTGAGISTSVGIPDFRGPTGVWTQQRRGKPPPKAAVPFSQARPSLTHQALLGLQARPQKPMTPPQEFSHSRRMRRRWRLRFVASRLSESEHSIGMRNYKIQNGSALPQRHRPSLETLCK